MSSARRFVTLLVVIGAVLAVSAVASAARPGFVFPDGCCYYNGKTVRTVVPPAAFPNQGTDPFYAIPGQKAVVGLAPGAKGYNGGHWAFHSVTFNVAPYLLTSEAAILTAAVDPDGPGGAPADVTITRDPARDFLCPIQK